MKNFFLVMLLLTGCGRTITKVYYEFDIACKVKDYVCRIDPELAGNAMADIASRCYSLALKTYCDDLPDKSEFLNTCGECGIVVTGQVEYEGVKK
jgi:hypothetical protein